MGPLDSFRGRADHTRKIKEVFEGWNFQSHIQPPAKIKGLETESNHVANDRRPRQNCSLKLSGASWLVNTLMCLEGGISRFHGEKAKQLSVLSVKNLPWAPLIWPFLICIF